MIRKGPAYHIKRLVMISVGALIMSLNLKIFCAALGIIPGGFTGVTLLFIETMEKYAHITLPFSVVLYILNTLPVYIGFRYIGKWFTFYSCVMVFLTGIITDALPADLAKYLNVNDYLLCAVFGGIVSSIAVIFCLKADATSGGTDLIAIYFSERRGTDTWNYIFAANCVILLIAAILFDAEKALYSIIYQFAATMTLSTLYKGYQQKTLLVITNKPAEVYQLIREKTQHDATSFSGIGNYSGVQRTMLYSVVSSAEAQLVVSAIKTVDADAFINVLRTDLLNGRFYKHPKN